MQDILLGAMILIFICLGFPLVKKAIRLTSKYVKCDHNADDNDMFDGK